MVAQLWLPGSTIIICTVSISLTAAAAIEYHSEQVTVSVPSVELRLHTRVQSERHAPLITTSPLSVIYTPLSFPTHQNVSARDELETISPATKAASIFFIESPSDSRWYRKQCSSGTLG